jgi:hypothetical protein
MARSPGAVPSMLRGSVVCRRRRCGKENCRCATGAWHETTVLSYSEDAKTHLVRLPAHQIDAVRAATSRYRENKARLEAEASANLALYVARLSEGSSGR